MPDIRPFRGLLYNPDKIKDMARVVTAPYDVISQLEQKAYYAADPYNIIRLILGKQYPQDTRVNNQYVRAKKFLSDWQKKAILLRDSKKAIYIYAQSFPHNKMRKTRTGFIALLKLEDFSKNTVLPHENTFSQPVQDRLKLLKATGANLSPIFSLFSEPQGKINKILSQHKRNHYPYVVIKKDRVLHKLWRMSDKRKIGTIKRLLKGRQIFIADGHHRYEAALNYKLKMQRRKKRQKKPGAFNYVMTYLVATEDLGVTILPTHRVVKIEARINPQKILQNLRESFAVRKFSTSGELFAYMRLTDTSRVFGAYFGKDKFYGLKLKRRTGLLDVTILHSLIIEPILNISHLFEEKIYYTRDAQEAIKVVNGQDYQVAFFLKAPTLTQLQKVARAGERMPHKSTYFYPKLLTGLVINTF